MPLLCVDAFPLPSKSRFSRLELQLPLLCFCFSFVRRLINRHASKGEVQECTAYGFLLGLDWFQIWHCGSRFGMKFLLLVYTRKESSVMRMHGVVQCFQDHDWNRLHCPYRTFSLPLIVQAWLSFTALHSLPCIYVDNLCVNTMLSR